MVSLALDGPIIETAEPSVDEKLAALSPDLTIGLFHEVLAAAYDPHVVGLSNFAAPNAKGTELQLRTVDNLRSHLVRMGWESSNAEQIPCIYNMTYQIRLACSTDGGPSVGREGFRSLACVVRVKERFGLRVVVQTLRHVCRVLSVQKATCRKIDKCAFYYLLF